MTDDGNADGDADGTDTTWEWLTYCKAGRPTTLTTPTPSVVITPAASLRFNHAAIDALFDAHDGTYHVDDAGNPTVDHVRFMVAPGARLVGFRITDEDDPNGYNVSTRTVSFQSVLSSFDVAKPQDSVLVELTAPDDDIPYIDMDDVETALPDGSGGDDT